jgi:hypothetical protein
MAVFRYCILNSSRPERGPKASLVARNICVGFADVTGASGVNLAYICHAYAQNSRTMCVIARVIMQMLRAPAARGLDPLVYVYGGLGIGLHVSTIIPK